MTLPSRRSSICLEGTRASEMRAKARRAPPCPDSTLSPFPGKGRWSPRTRASVPDVHGKPSRGTDRPGCGDRVGLWPRSSSATLGEGLAKYAAVTPRPPFSRRPSLARDGALLPLLPHHPLAQPLNGTVGTRLPAPPIDCRTVECLTSLLCGALLIEHRAAS